jgi:hypothetical protein
MTQDSIKPFLDSSIARLDTLPKLDYEQLKFSVRNIFAIYPTLFDNILFLTPSKRSSDGDRKVLRLRPSNYVDSTILAYPIVTHLLAWTRVWLPCNNETRDSVAYNVPEHEVCYDALVWAEITQPKSKDKRWALMVFRTIGSKWDLVWDVGSLDKRHSPVRVFQRQPRNEDIYNYLDSVRSNGRSIFDFKYSFSECENVLCMCGRFIDGDVRENTWIAVTGEKPTKFFPNGK